MAALADLAAPKLRARRRKAAILTLHAQHAPLSGPQDRLQAMLPQGNSTGSSHGFSEAKASVTRMRANRRPWQILVGSPQPDCGILTASTSKSQIGGAEVLGRRSLNCLGLSEFLCTSLYNIFLMDLRRQGLWPSQQQGLDMQHAPWLRRRLH